jgi:hypothetical protein
MIPPFHPRKTKINTIIIIIIITVIGYQFNISNDANELFFNTYVKCVARNRPNCDEVVSYCLLAVQYDVSVPVLSVCFNHSGCDNL